MGFFVGGWSKRWSWGICQRLFWGCVGLVGAGFAHGGGGGGADDGADDF